MIQRCADALPKWVPQRYLPAHFRRYTGDVVEQRVYFAVQSRGRHFYELSDVHRLLGPACDRDGYIYVRSSWYWYARLELFLQSCLHWVVSSLIRQRILAGPEGGWFHEFRLNDPARWRWK